MSEKVKVNIYMSEDMLAALKKLAKLQDRPYAELVRVACKAFIVANAKLIAEEREIMDKAGK
jgi:hypothetical protein